MSADYKFLVTAMPKSIETGDPAPGAAVDPGRYTQHNLAVGDGLAGFGAALAALPKDSARVRTVRVFQDGKIVEHWDNLQATPARAFVDDILVAGRMDTLSGYFAEVRLEEHQRQVRLLTGSA